MLVFIQYKVPVETMSGDSFVIGMAGGTGAGKTAVAEALSSSVDEPVSILSLDNYYRDHSDRSLEARSEINYDHPDAFEWELLVDQLEQLTSGSPIEMPQYDFTTHTRTDERVRIEPTKICIVEGILSLYNGRLRDCYDLSVYVHTDADVRILRRIERDVIERGRTLEGVIEQYLETVKPMHERYVEPTKRHADLIVPEGLNHSAVSVLSARIRSAIDGAAIEATLP